MQKILRYAFDAYTELFIINRYFTCFEAVNLKQTLTIYSTA